MMIRSSDISFSEKKISRNAVITLVFGAGEIAGFLLLMLWSVLSGGHISLIGGLLGCIFFILSIFGALWGIFSFDDIKTRQLFKISGIVLNVIGFFFGLIFFML